MTPGRAGLLGAERLDFPTHNWWIFCFWVLEWWTVWIIPRIFFTCNWQHSHLDREKGKTLALHTYKQCLKAESAV